MASYAKTIASAVVSVIQGLATAPAQTVLRKFDTLLLPDKSLASNIVCIVTLSQEQAIVAQSFGNGSTDFGTVVRAYLIGITLYKLHNATLQTNVDSLPAMALSIEQALNKPTLSGAPSVVDTQLEPFTEFEQGNFKDGYEVLKCHCVFFSAENRNS